MSVKNLLFIASIFFASGCGHHYTTGVPQQDASVPDTAPYQCRSGCNCDLGYCDSPEPAEGRWYITPTHQHRLTMGATELVDDTPYPYTDSDGCTHGLAGTVSVIPDHNTWDGYFNEWYGWFYADFSAIKMCGEYIWPERFQQVYTYWGFCVEGLMCGMYLYDMDSSMVGAIAYTISQKKAQIIYNTPEFWGSFWLEFYGQVGDCVEGQVHCYKSDSCTELIADCVRNEEDCTEMGGESYSYHANADHYNEPCLQ